ncbi:hypothetical protein A0128_13145 [Leptospira tipperaryensis]|uniref:DUF1554 domain-containing protein n=1 Tax=Leptospira tipperaryensis TaxID=2564040 RepID=A0A1D7UYS3_9LEPT|nr:DUF1554 domain-containing protein [Leptospira tipperaryensis]AOP34715.1 hypothetical protein A0128_13145 [Leptospira tipperaryensis]
MSRKIFLTIPIGIVFLTVFYCTKPKDSSNEDLFDLIVASNQISSSSTNVSCQNSTFCRTFIATNNGAGYTGNLGGITGADLKCATERPSGLTGTYKAFLVSTGTRTISPAKIDWVLYANKEYRRKDGTTVTFTTNAQAIVSGNFTNGIDGGTQTFFWDGLSDATWNVGNTCQGWTSSLAGDGGQAGNTTDTAAFGAGAGGAFAVDTWNCNLAQRLLCVEQ